MLRRVPAERAFSSSLFYGRVVRRENEKKGSELLFGALASFVTDRYRLPKLSFVEQFPFAVVARPRAFPRVSISSPRRALARIQEQKYLRRCGDDSTCTLYSLTVHRDVMMRHVSSHRRPFQFANGAPVDDVRRGTTT